MKLINVIACLLLVGGMVACQTPNTQPTAVPAVPSQYRLKSVQSTDSYTYTYSYDSQNRPVSINRVTNGVISSAVITYGDPQRNYIGSNDDVNRTFYIEYPNPADQTSGTITPYPLPLTGTNFQTTKYALFNSKIYTSTVVRSYLYTFNTSQQLTDYSESGNAPNVNSFKYTTTDDNVTTEQYSYAGGRGDRGTATYTYDSKPNPFLGLMDPGINLIQRTSRNNVQTKVNASDRNFNSGVTTYAYDYNAQGLPTKRTATYNGAVVETLVYIYESY